MKLRAFRGCNMISQIITFVETERLILRSWKPGDLPLFVDMNKDPLVMKYFQRC